MTDFPVYVLREAWEAALAHLSTVQAQAVALLSADAQTWPAGAAHVPGLMLMTLAARVALTALRQVPPAVLTALAQDWPTLEAPQVEADPSHTERRFDDASDPDRA